MGGRPQLFLYSFLLTSLSTAILTAQTANQAWLDREGNFTQTSFPRQIRALGSDVLERSAVEELKRNLLQTIPTLDLEHGTDAGITARVKETLRGQTVVGTIEEVHRAFPELPIPKGLRPESYWLYTRNAGDNSLVVIAGADGAGILYGTFAFLRHSMTNETANLYDHPIRSTPAYKIRWVDQWDNPDGGIERGYAGRSIFFENGNVRQDLAPISEYARLLASSGINGCNINNVNAAPQLLDSAHLQQIARIADALRPWGVHLAMSVAIASPQTIGGLPTYDPLDPTVKAWWAAKANEIYTLIPDFAGFTVKADSEGQPGPSSFGRTPADAANTLAAALAPHGGLVLYRAFVYNHHLDWHDPKADRARAAYDIFHPLDGKFAPNVIIQTKEGPIDFQVREPVSPLFAGLQHTSQAMELQITQEYTGQQRHLVYLAPMWKQVLDTDLRAIGQPVPNQPRPSGAPGPSHLGTGESTTVKAILAGQILAGQKTQRQPLEVSGHDFSRAANPSKLDRALAPAKPPFGGLIGVSGIGQDHWLASPLALVNLYAFGRLAWDPNLTPEQIAEEWTRQTISTDPSVVATVDKILMQSWPAYEDYTGPLGLQTLTDITGSHYGPNIESSERNGWGQWHNADAAGVGKDRTVATGSGYASQYPPELAKIYESAAKTPDNLLLFFHHVPYTYKLHDGKTVIQYLYDSHYDGAAQVAQFAQDWTTLQAKIDPTLYADVLARLQYQAGHAIVWRDAIVQYFLKLSGIPDEKGRAGHYPNRLEAEDARLTGYKIIDITPWEDASRGKAVICDAEAKGTGFSPYIQPGKTTGASALEGTQACTVDWTWTGPAGRYSIAVQYFDLQPGTAKFTLSINNLPTATWTADANLPSTHPNGDNSTRRTIPNIDLKPGDTIRIEGTPDQSDPAALDYIEIIP
jgi:alpha-glucuronidase